jgi:arylsulfatase A-like enzyme
MPNVLKMQKDGVTFSNYFVTDSLCCPSRSSIFTGQYPHDTGVYTNDPPDGGFEGFNSHGNESHTFAVALQKAGYKTALLGKYLNGYFPIKSGPAKGWNEWDVAGDGYPEFNYNLNQNGSVTHYANDPKDYLTDVVAGIGSEFIRKAGSNPFFIEIATFAPHAPYIPAPRDADKFPGLTAPRTAAFGARPDSQAPTWLKRIPPMTPNEIQNIDKDFRMRAQSVLSIDKMVGELRSIVPPNTYILFSSDNGYHMGEYSMHPGKMTPFDTDIRVPLIVVGPGVPKGKVVDRITENVDLCPTFTEMGGSSAGTSPDGHSLLSFLQGIQSKDWRRLALIEHHGPVTDPTNPDMPGFFRENPPSYEAMRLENAMYVEYQGGETGYYDLKKDPEELKNVVSSLSAEIRKRLHQILETNEKCHGLAACWKAQQMVQ